LPIVKEKKRITFALAFGKRAKKVLRNAIQRKTFFLFFFVEIVCELEKRITFAVPSKKGVIARWQNE
jgi:hypothetical protein